MFHKFQKYTPLVLLKFYKLCYTFVVPWGTPNYTPERCYQKRPRRHRNTYEACNGPVVMTRQNTRHKLIGVFNYTNFYNSVYML